jgi:CheY-like chemotaxis protein
VTDADTAAGSTPPPAETDSESIRVLLVDDDEDFVALASTLLEAESDRIDTTTETNPQHALEATEFETIDCVVSDFRMPELDGIEFLETIRETYPELPFILFTGKGDEEVAKRAIAADVSDYIVKDGSAEQYAISANRIENLVAQYHTRQQARRQRRLDTLSQQALDTALSEPTRAAIETGICTHLVDTDLYAAAWIVESDPHSEAITARTQAGETALLADLSAVAAREDSVEAQAMATGGHHVASDIAERDDAWAVAAADHGMAAAIGVPITRAGVPYGVLGVYTTRSDLGDDEVATLRTIADLTAFAIGASERRQGDTSQEVTEVTFDASTTDLPFVRVADAVGCAVEISQTSHRSDGTTRTVYRLADPPADAAETAETVVSADVEQVDGAADTLSIASDEPWWVALTESYGANIAAASADDDGATITVELPPNVTVRAVVDTLTAHAPGIEPVARQQRARRERSLTELEATVAERLTDRQQEVVETAYEAGYYEWPHAVSSEAVADLLGIAQPTFAEHFWAAQRRIVESLFDPDNPE